MTDTFDDRDRRDAARDDDPDRRRRHRHRTTGRASSSPPASRTSTFECAIDGRAVRGVLQPGPVRRARARPAHVPGPRASTRRLNADPTPATLDVDVRAGRRDARDDDPSRRRPTRQHERERRLPFSARRARDRVRVRARRRAVRVVRVAVPDQELAAGRARRSSCARIDVFLGNVEPTPASYTWRVIAPPLEPTIDSAPPEPERGQQPHVHVLLDRAERDVRVPDHAEPVPPSTRSSRARRRTRTPNLPDGEYMFEVRAVNEFGIAGEIPAEHSFEVANPPDTTIVARPDRPRPSQHDRGFAFTSSEPGVDVRVLARRRRAFVECLSPAMFPDTEMGWPDAGRSAPTRSWCRPIDINGNIDPTPASRTWTVVEPTAPETTIVAGPGRPRPPARPPRFGFSSTEPGATFECSLDGAAFAACTVAADVHRPERSATTSCASRATDADGNVDPTPAAYTWTVVEPDTVGAGDDDRLRCRPIRPAAPTRRFTFSRNEAGSTFECALDGARLRRLHLGQGYTGLAAGPHTFSVRATDPSEQRGRDAGQPHLDDRHGGAGHDDHRAGRPTRAAATSSASASRAPTTSAAAARDRLRVPPRRPAPWVACADPKSYVDLTAGPHTFSVRAIDAAGNVDPTPATYSWTVDTAAPETTIDSGPPTTSTSTSASFTFAVRGRRRPTSARSTAAPYAACTLAGRRTPASPPATHTLRGARDRRGRQRRPEPGDPRLDGRPARRTRRSTPGRRPRPRARPPTFTFSSNEAGATFECALDARRVQLLRLARPRTRRSATGTHEFRVRAKDSAGNVDPTPASYTWTVTAPPETTIDTVVPDMD